MSKLWMGLPWDELFLQIRQGRPIVLRPRLFLSKEFFDFCLARLDIVALSYVKLWRHRLAAYKWLK
jgi:hypothetical protein